MSTAERLLTRVRDAMYADEAAARADRAGARTARRCADGMAASIAADVDRCARRSRRARRGQAARHLSAGAAGVAARRGDRARRFATHPVVIVSRRDGLRQDDAAAEDLPRRRAAASAGSSATRSRGGSPRARSRRASRRSSARRSAKRSATRSASPTSTRPDAYIKLMTDGILLAETQGDRDLAALRHDHRRRGARAQPQHRFPARLPAAAARRSGRISRSSSRRRRSTPSASRGTSRRRRGPAPVIEVSGRTYPVEVRYRPLRSATTPKRDDEEELEEAIVDAAEDLWREGPGRHPRVPARRARDPRDGATCCGARSRGVRMRAAIEILPLFARLVGRRAAARVRAVRAAGASCSRPTSPRRR